MHNEFERMWQEAVVTLFELQRLCVPGVTEKTAKTLSIFCPRGKILSKEVL